MASVKLYSEGAMSFTGISNIFLDQYMPEANGEFVKVYLYLLRSLNDPSKECSVSAIADYFNHTENDVTRALLYWSRVGVIRLDLDERRQLTGIALLPLTQEISQAVPAQTVPVSAAPVPATSVPATPVPAVSAPQPREYSVTEVEEFRRNPEVRELLFVIESYLKKPITQTDVQFCLFWFDQLQLAPELIEYLAEACISKGHTSFRYMNRIAINWAEEGIVTIEQAREQFRARSKPVYTVMKALGIRGRDLAKTELADLNRWTGEWNFELPLIEEACRRTIEAIHEPSFSYINKILETWFKNDVHTLADVQKLDAKHSEAQKISVNASENIRPTKFSNFEGRNNDYDQLEKMLIKSTAQ